MSNGGISLGLLEAAGIAFGGSFVGALAEYGHSTSGDVISAAVVGAVAFFAALGYGGYTAHRAAQAKAAAATG